METVITELEPIMFRNISMESLWVLHGKMAAVAIQSGVLRIKLGRHNLGLPRMLTPFPWHYFRITNIYKDFILRIMENICSFLMQT